MKISSEEELHSMKVEYNSKVWAGHSDFFLRSVVYKGGVT